MQACIFCKISKHEIPSEVVSEDEAVIVFKDIHPKANVHWLAVPKKHISSLKEAAAEDWPAVLRVIQKAVKVAQDNNLAGYKLVFNVGREGGQVVEHIHLHLLAGGLNYLEKATPIRECTRMTRILNLFVNSCAVPRSEPSLRGSTTGAIRN